MRDQDNTGKVAVVTGGAQGIGLAVVKRLLESGASVAIWDMDEALGQSVATSLGDKARAYAVNVADTLAVAEAAVQVKDDLGPIAIMVNSAGVAGSNARVIDYDPDEWRRILEINLTGTFNMNRAVLPQMVKSGYGRVVNIASVAGKEGNPNAAAY